MTKRAIYSLISVFLSLLLTQNSFSAQEYIKVDVKGKPTDKSWTQRETITLDLLEDFKPGKTPPLDKFGGKIGEKFEATGFFYPKKVNNRWWLIDPDGNQFMHIAVNGVSPGSKMDRESAIKKFGDCGKWADYSAKLLAINRFNGTAGWSDTEYMRNSVNPPVYTLSWAFMSSFGRSLKLTYQASGHSGYQGDVMPIFHPDFPKFCDEYAKQLEKTKDDPYLLGHFSDNELPVQSVMLDNSLKLEPNDPIQSHSYNAAKDWLDKRKGSNWKPENITDADRDEFLEYVMDTYYRITTAAIRKYDPNHLCLGSRLHGRATRYPLVFKAAGKHLDVVSVNLYGHWTPRKEMLQMWAAQSDKPFIITEWYAKGMDSGLPNNSGAGWTVKTQNDRGLFYQNFTIALMQNKACVGWHWFKFRDNNPLDLSTDPSNRDSNKGIVNCNYEPYFDLLNKMKDINTQAYNLIDHFDALSD